MMNFIGRLTTGIFGESEPNAPNAAVHTAATALADAEKAAESAAQVESVAQVEIDRLVATGADDEAIDTGQRAAQRASLRRKHAERVRDEAKAALDAATAALAEHEARIKAEAEVARVAELERQASVETLRETVAPMLSDLIAAMRAVREHSEAIDAAVNRANEAGSSIGLPQIDAVWPAMGIFEALDVTPSEHALMNLRHQMAPNSGAFSGKAHNGGLARVLLQGFDAIEKIDEEQISNRGARREELADCRSFRACEDAVLAVRKRRAEVAEAERIQLENTPAAIARRAAYREEQDRLGGKLPGGVRFFDGP